jgi:hypothetical protein
MKKTDVQKVPKSERERIRALAQQIVSSKEELITILNKYLETGTLTDLEIRGFAVDPETREYTVFVIGNKDGATSHYYYIDPPGICTTHAY